MDGRITQGSVHTMMASTPRLSCGPRLGGIRQGMFVKTNVGSHPTFCAAAAGSPLKEDVKPPPSRNVGD